MNFQFYFEKLSESAEFKKFKSKNRDCYLCSAFFSIDRQGQDNRQHLDFYIPSEKKTFSFQLEKAIEPVLLERLEKFIPEKINNKINFDFDEIEELIYKKMKDEKINSQIHKIFYSLQNVKGKNFLIGTIFISKLGIIKLTFNLDEKKFVDFNRKSIFDMMKIFRR